MISKYKSKVDPAPIGDTDGRAELILKLKSGNELWLDHTTGPPSYFISGGVANYYISDRQAIEVAKRTNYELQMTREDE